MKKLEIMEVLLAAVGQLGLNVLRWTCSQCKAPPPLIVLRHVGKNVLSLVLRAQIAVGTTVACRPGTDILTCVTRSDPRDTDVHFWSSGYGSRQAPLS